MSLGRPAGRHCDILEITLLLSWVKVLVTPASEKPRSGTPAEVAACERVQQKAAVTLARLSRDPDVAREAVRLSCEWCWLGQGWWRGGPGWEQS